MEFEYYSCETSKSSTKQFEIVYVKPNKKNYRSMDELISHLKYIWSIRGKNIFKSFSIFWKSIIFGNHLVYGKNDFNKPMVTLLSDEKFSSKYLICYFYGAYIKL